MKKTNRSVASPAYIRGDLQLEIRDALSDSVIKRMAIKNTITYKGLLAPLKLLAQDGITVGDYRITRLWAGSNGIAPTRSDTALGSPTSTDSVTGGAITLTALNRTISEATSELIITATLGSGRANGTTLREVGLFTANGDMFARQVHPGVEKSSLITVSYTWRLATIGA